MERGVFYLQVSPVFYIFCIFSLESLVDTDIIDLLSDGQNDILTVAIAKNFTDGHPEVSKHVVIHIVVLKCR